MLMDLARQLSGLQEDQYKNSSIARLHWQYGEAEHNENGLRILEKRHHLIKTSCTITKGKVQARLETSLILHCIPQVISDKTENQAAAIFWRSFSLTDITDFVKSVGDKNPIHEGPAAVVPGILLLSEVLNTITDIKEVSMRFYHAALAGEALYWEQLDMNHAEVYSGGKKIFNLIIGKPTVSGRNDNG